MPPTEKFVFEKLLKNEYKYEVIGGQHITQADHEIIIANYTTETLPYAPQSLVYKQVVIWVNLSKEEKALVVTVDNQRIQKPESNMDKVKLKTNQIVILFFISFATYSICSNPSFFIYFRQSGPAIRLKINVNKSFSF